MSTTAKTASPSRRFKAGAPRRGKTHPPLKNRVWDFFEHTYSCASENWQITQCSRPENQPTPTTTASGVLYYGYRYYSPPLGRFASRDPIGEDGGLNVYQFVLNDPVFFVDRLGLNRSNCRPFTDRFEISGGLLGYLGVSGNIDGMFCDCCCNGTVIQNGYMSFNGVSAATINFGVGFVLDVNIPDITIPESVPIIGGRVIDRINIGASFTGPGASLETAFSGEFDACSKNVGKTGKACQRVRMPLGAESISIGFNRWRAIIDLSMDVDAELCTETSVVSDRLRIVVSTKGTIAGSSIGITLYPSGRSFNTGSFTDRIGDIWNKEKEILNVPFKNSGCNN